MSHSSRRLVRSFSVLLGVIALLLCLASTAFAASNDDMAYVRVIHASPAAGTVDVFVDGKSLLTNFTFGTVTDYVSVPAGSHEIKVAPAGKGIDAAVITQSVSVNGGLPYTVAAVGTKDSGFSLQAFADNNLMPGNMAKVRVYHLSPNAGPVDIATGGKTAVSGLTYEKATDYLTVPAGSYTFNVTATQANATLPLNADLKAGTVTSVFAIGLYNGDPALKFVTAVVNGVPSGMPNTGASDPQVVANKMALPWILSVVAVLSLASLAVAGRVAYTFNKKRS